MNLQASASQQRYQLRERIRWLIVSVACVQTRQMMKLGHSFVSATRALISLRTSAVGNCSSDEKWSEPFVWS